MLCLHGPGSKRIQKDPVWKSDRIDLLFTQDQTDPKLDVLFCRSSFGSIPFLFQMVPCKQKTIQSGSVRNGSGPVPCKHSLKLAPSHIIIFLYKGWRQWLPCRDKGWYTSFVHVFVYSACYFSSHMPCKSVRSTMPVTWFSCRRSILADNFCRESFFSDACVSTHVWRVFNMLQFLTKFSALHWTQ